jgi:AcrR family transcriptional regulator/predicted DNA-binding transcriptional regulator AlpA
MRKNMKKESYFRISELSKLSGISVPQIRGYIKKGIVPKPLKAAKTVAYYTQNHMERLKLIEEMEAEKISPDFLKKMIDSINEIKDTQRTNEFELPRVVRNKLLESGTILNKIMDSISGTEGTKDFVEANMVQILKNRIIDSCIPIFRKKGYERTTITDITKAADIGRNTFYLYFKDKKELFIECLSKLFSEWKGERAKYTQKDLLVLIKKMFLAFYKVYPRWSDMMALFRAAAMKYPSDFADRLEQTLNSRIHTIADDVKRAIKHGEIREINCDLLAMMIAGVSELVCYYLYRGRFRDIEMNELVDQMMDIWTHGIKRE